MDFSNLNNKKQGIDEEGESGATFQGMLNWVDRHRPTIVIVENVLSAPWDRSVCPKFRRVGYAAEWTKLDTKAFYIPHTRQRGYMCAVDMRTSSKGSPDLCVKIDVQMLKDAGKAKQVDRKLHLNGQGDFSSGSKSSIPAKWKTMVKRLERPASSPIEAFLLPEDDPRIVRTRASFQDAQSRRSVVDWARCEVRHRDARFAEEIGEKRPLTLWQEGGGCALPDFAWNDWAVTQPERVLDLMDISMLRYAVKGVDASFKTIVWNLSQNVDRIGYPKGGLSPCMTPTMIPYISNRGGPMTGYEALGMQGLPVDRLLLTRESEDNCMDLAGNAMSTTVVGSCIMSALVLATEQLKKHYDLSDDGWSEQSALSHSQISQFVGEHRLSTGEQDLAKVNKVSISELIRHAQQSRRLCECEGRTTQTSRRIVQCIDCEFTACTKCQGRPEHNYPRHPDGKINLDAFSMQRLDPKLFEKELKRAIPMRVTFDPNHVAVLEEVSKRQQSLGISDEVMKVWREGCSKAFSHELRFRTLRRQEVWSATWDSEHALLELVLDPRLPEWRLFVKPDVSLEASSDVRTLFSQPVARLALDCTKEGSLLEGTWDLCLPSSKTFELTLTGGQAGEGEIEAGVDDHGDLVPSWEMSLGLLAHDFKAKRVWKFLDISIDQDAGNYLDAPISGRYHLVDKCGCASNSLHKLEGKHMYFFLDPKRCTGADADYFVFSVSQRRYVYGESRPIAARLSPRWRQFGQALHHGKVIRTNRTKCTVDGKWVSVQGLSLRPSAQQIATISLPDPQRGFNIDVTKSACAGADALLVCKLPMAFAESVWTENWTEVDPIHQRRIFGAVSWLTERLRGIQGLDQWMTLSPFSSTYEESTCERCAPAPPEVFFGEVFYRPKSKGAKCSTRIQGVEDIGEAGRFEQGLKNRPVPFATQLRLKDGVAELRIGLNVASLLHQALSRLPKGPKPAVYSWRLDTSYVEKQRLVLPTFKKALEQNSNRDEVEAKQPPNFKIPLRKEQLRSLTWMLRQESPEVKPWIEQEIVEAILTPLSWRAEAKASRSIDIKGGVLADEVGYGKTAITLGLIDSSPQRRVEPDNVHGLISTRATLIIVPGHLIKQWPSEITKFLGRNVKTISIENAGHLKKHTIEDFQNADIVCVSGGLLKNKSYLGQLGALAGGVYLPDNSDKGGRYFDQKHAEAMAGLRKTVEDLKKNDAAKVWRDINEGRSEDLESRKAVFIQKKRMKGRAFREAKAEERLKKGQPIVPAVKVAEVYSKKVKSQAIPIKKSQSKLNVAEVPMRIGAWRKKRRVICLSSDEDEDDDSYQSNPDLTAGSDVDDGEPYCPKSIMKSDKFSVLIRSNLAPCPPAQHRKTESKPLSPGGSSTTRPLSDDDNEEMTDPLASDLDETCPTIVETAVMEIDGLGEDDLDENGEIIDVRADMTQGLKADRGAEVNNALRSDPWHLSRKDVQRDYRKMHSPVLEMFNFNRFVIDEYTYLKDKLHKMTMNMKSDRRWILSGTPPLEDFMAIKTISVFLGVDLGINDIPPNPKAQKHWFNEFTAVEKFHSFRETKSFAWHTERHRQAERFLKQFMRQNKPEINEIPATETHHKVVLPAAERAIYLELLHHLQALDMNIKKSKKGASDRDRRITESFGESQSAEEALIKRCAHFDYSTAHDQEDNAIYECDRLVETRTRQLRECEVQLHDTLWELFEEEDADTRGVRQDCVGLHDKDSIFRTWLMHMASKGTIDGDATVRVRRMIDACEGNIRARVYKKPTLQEFDTDAARRQNLRYNKKTRPIVKEESMSQFLTPAQKKKLAMGQSLSAAIDEDDPDDSDAQLEPEEEEDSEMEDMPRRKRTTKKSKVAVVTKKAQGRQNLSDDDDDEGDDGAPGDKLISKQPDWMDVKKGLFKDKSHMLKRIEKELVGRVKSLRFFEVVRDVQRLNSTTIPAADKPAITFLCPGPNCRHRFPDGRKRPLALPDVCVFSTCGHSGCHDCLRAFAADQKCPQQDCLSPGTLNVIVKSTSLGEEEDIRTATVAGKHWGTKIEDICHLIQHGIPHDEKVILFSQFRDLTETVDAALHEKGIPRIRITGSASAKSKALGKFQDPGATERVLVLQADDESASGANLTVANHVIFVAPLLAETAGQYQAQEVQAIGRVKRFGQKRHVHIHRFLTSDTIDVEIFEKREREKVMADEDEPEEY